MQDVSAQEFGVYKERTNSNTKAIADVSKDIDSSLGKVEANINSRLDKIDLKLDGLVTRNEFDKHLEWSLKSVELLGARITILEQFQHDDQKSVSSNIKKVLSKKSIDLFVNLIFILFGGLLVAYLLSQNFFQVRPLTVDENIQDKVIEK